MYDEDIPYEIVGGEQSKEARREYWELAKGLQRVDGLETSPYLEKVQREYVEGRYSSTKAKDVVDGYYLNGKGSTENEEADRVSARMVTLLEQGGFSFSPATLLSIHRTLFDGVFPVEWVGKWRIENISKKEPILFSNSVVYADKDSIDDILRYDFGCENGYRYKYPLDASQIRHLAKFISDIWQVHPFREGNTRTIAIFTQLYMRSMGIPLDNELFKAHSKFFRNALVRANYANVREGINPDESYLEAFLENVLGGKENDIEALDLTCEQLRPEAERPSPAVEEGRVRESFSSKACRAVETSEIHEKERAKRNDNAHSSKRSR